MILFALLLAEPQHHGMMPGMAMPMPAKPKVAARPKPAKGKAKDVVAVLEELTSLYPAPAFIRSDNGPEFAAKRVRTWLEKVGVNTLFIEPGSPWENGYIESFNGKLRDELLNTEIFDTLLEARVLTEL